MQRQTDVSERGSPEEAAAYVADMAGALARIARGHGLEVLGYLLDMARLEARGIAGAFEPPAADHQKKSSQTVSF